jgi:thiol-disulfide isomerase/thioredoxin
MASATVYFFKMNGCGHCIALQPVWNEVEQYYAKKGAPIVFKTIEHLDISGFAQTHPETAALLKTSEIFGFPDIRMVVKKGRSSHASTYVGVRSAKDIEKWIDSNLGTKRKSSTKHGGSRMKKRASRRRRASKHHTRKRSSSKRKQGLYVGFTS